MLNNLRIGQSKDIHKLTTGKLVKIGGIDFKVDYSVVAHSDGDVLLHAISEAILGALGKKDLGTHFPIDKINAQRNSSEILEIVLNMMRQENYQIINIDSLIIVDNIKIAPLNDAIKNNLINIIEVENINVKATTSEGKHENYIEAQAVVLLMKK